MTDSLQELRDDRVALLQTLREATKLIKVLLDAHEEIERDYAIGMFTKESFERDRRLLQEIEESLRG